MDKNRVVITGIGVISPNGIGKDAFWSASFSGLSGIKPISLFDTSSFKVKSAGEIKDFDPQIFLGPKGLRTLDRSTKLVSSATKLALDDAGLVITEENTHKIGVAVGNTLGSVYSISEFDKDALRDGPQYVNPALFPNTVINSPASQVSIKFNIKGFNTTISTGFSSALDAIKYAADFIKLGRAEVVLAAGVEELCVQTFLGFYRTAFLAGIADSSLELSCPFDKRRNGIVLGEASAVLVLESLESARMRKANIYAEVIGAGRGFDSYRINKYNPNGTGLKFSMRSALKNSGVKADTLDYISSAANSTIEADRIEAQAIREVFGRDADRVYVSSVKSMTGECFSATGALQVALAAGAIQQQSIPPNINYSEKDPDCDLGNIVTKKTAAKVENVLVNAFGPSGCNTTVVISKFRG